jgi:dTDP-glucose 4,6-dehydratase
MTLAELIADTMHLPLKAELINTYSVRPGHDLRYALNGSLLEKAGWTPGTSMEVTVAETVNWYLSHQEWL